MELEHGFKNTSVTNMSFISGSLTTYLPWPDPLLKLSKSATSLTNSKGITMSRHRDLPQITVESLTQPHWKCVCLWRYRCGLKTLINLQRPGEHASCGNPLETESGFTYRPEVFMENDSQYQHPFTRLNAILIIAITVQHTLHLTVGAKQPNLERRLHC